MGKSRKRNSFGRSRRHTNTHAKRQRQTGSYLGPLRRVARQLGVPLYVGKSRRRVSKTD